MKLKDGFILRQVAGETVAIPVSGSLDLNQMITLNETGLFIWKLLEQETDAETILAKLLSEYDVEEATAKRHVDDFIKLLKEHDFFA